MTEVAIREGDDRTPAVRQGGTIAHLADWAEEARAAYQLAATLCKTSFVPAHFKNKPEEATAAILTGHEMGMSPMAALRAIYVISGTPGMYAAAMRAVALSRGHKVWVAEASPERVVVRGQRAGSEQVQESVWTIDRAKQAGLLNNAQYTKNPQNMLTARGTAEVARLIAADALHGLHAVEEMDDLEPRRVEAVAAPRVTAKEILGQPEPEAMPDSERERHPEPESDEPPLWPEVAQPGGER